jgi:hydroxyacylglutathione hydrolase
LPAPQFQLIPIVSQLFMENAYILYLAGSDSCLVVDPGLDVGQIIAAIEQRNLTPAVILNTHGHADHIAGNAALKQRWPDAPLVIGTADASKLTDAVANLSAGHGVPIVSPPADKLLNEGDCYEAAGFKLEVLDTPGHCCGHIVFVWKAASPWIVLGGDVLFQGSIGRTDFPDSSFSDLEHSIQQKLFKMPDDTVVYPGHGPPTTIGEEKRTNPFVGVPAGYRES